MSVALRGVGKWGGDLDRDRERDLDRFMNYLDQFLEAKMPEDAEEGAKLIGRLSS